MSALMPWAIATFATEAPERFALAQDLRLRHRAVVAVDPLILVRSHRVHHELTVDTIIGRSAARARRDRWLLTSLEMVSALTHQTGQLLSQKAPRRHPIDRVVLSLTRTARE